jgi:Cft2 family RNA processing exonuclease
MKLTDLNRFGGIGANCMLAEFGAIRIIIDCGINPKKDGREATPELGMLRQFPADAVVLTHCHLDHLGALPLVSRACPEAPIMLTLPSAHLAKRLLRNGVNVMKRTRDEQGIADYPLFTMTDVDDTASRMVGMHYKRARKLTKGDDEVEVTFFQAGHVAGAAGVQIIHNDRAYFFTGDVQFDDQRIVGGARFPSREFDVIVTETTRGATERQEHLAREREVTRLLATIHKTIERGGSVLIPVFALGRMQEIFLVLNEARLAGNLPKVPIFAAGLGMDLCNYLDEITETTGLINFRRSVLRDLEVQAPKRNIVTGREPDTQGIYVVSSGMLVENTPSYKWASCMLGREHHSICFVGYCDPDTPGGHLLATPKGEVFVFDTLDYQTPVRASIERFEMTGHADREELLEFAIHSKPKTVVLTHGDPPAREWFRKAFAEQAPGIRVIDPEPLETFEV